MSRMITQLPSPDFDPSENTVSITAGGGPKISLLYYNSSSRKTRFYVHRFPTIAKLKLIIIGIILKLISRKTGQQCTIYDCQHC